MSSIFKIKIKERKKQIMSNSDRIVMLEARKALLAERNPVENQNIIRKLERKIRQLSK